MNANTALKIDEAIDQAVWCGESLTDIETQIHNALMSALRRLAEARVKEAQANLDAVNAGNEILS